MQCCIDIDGISEGELQRGCYALRVTIAASSRPVSLDEFKRHCRKDGDDEDAVLQIYLDAATEFVSERCGLTLAPTSFRAERPRWWQGALFISTSPLRSITEISYIDPAGSITVVSEESYRWERKAEGGFIHFNDGFEYPDTFSIENAIRVDFDAGFDDPMQSGSGDDPELKLPSRAKQAIQLIAAHWYQNREMTLIADRAAAVDLPLAAEALMGQLRNYL